MTVFTQNGKYPSPYQYPATNAPLPDKKQFDNARSYHTDYQSHRVDAYASRKPSYSTMTMTTQNDNNSSIHGRGEEKQDYPNYSAQYNSRRPVSRSETANNRSKSSHYHHTAQQAHEGKRRRARSSQNRAGYYTHDGYGTAGPYVQYPNEPHSYYTMNGVNRVHSTPRGGHGYFSHY